MSVTKSASSAQTYRNAMEALVTEEVEKQLQHLPARITSYLNKAEVVAYALNRLPSLYATSEKGWQQQCKRAYREYATQIVTAVRQAIAAVQQDPLRTGAPLRSGETWEAQTALQGLRELLQHEGLSWVNLVETVEHTLIKTTRGEITWRKRGKVAQPNHEWENSRYL